MPGARAGRLFGGRVVWNGFGRKIYSGGIL